MTLTKSFAALMIAVSIEVIATTLLSLSNSFQRPVVGLSAIISYGISYYFLSIALRRIHLGVAYAIWSAVGLFSMTVIQTRLFDYIVSQRAWMGLGMVIAGTITLNLAIKQNK
ncbi:DMT family transporter [Enterobacter hormaechei]|uniref:DMT family transporter n=1 Tax=Enterobacter hormaechei TaxID=158836 RepID=UPI00188BE1A7|nr:SMR family transporter [Enterobacter hormaechei]ELD3313694.1 QacE family quaternary ammonium compound efflux SMR transporter [Enterobacter hormaechei]ELD3470771.1 QacE family quaternary ammonium compound efflux SMR transporter [Enterobacter hormaechei]ELD3484648.1 QacE family quaternary ammonium compound efflux SMR transporter [Enterobacter hormaechei]MBF4165082.1 QacE family quaternary ammonium compound efflux SMR transporter [Enterobacter hormaechei]MBJ6599404.1 QacE family quaternary amm